MKIATIETNIPVTWQGLLAAYNETASRQDIGVSASVGEPFQWSDQEMMGEQWRPSAAGDRYYLLQLAFTLTPHKNTRINSAEFRLSLGSLGDKRARVLDVYPREHFSEENQPVILAIGPDFRFRTDESSIATAETTIDFGRVTSKVWAEGLGEDRIRWRFTSHGQHSISGSQRMFAIVFLPPDLKTVPAAFELSVNIETRMGRIPISPPERDWAKFRFSVGEIASKTEFRPEARLAGDSTSDAPPPEGKKKKGKRK